MNDPKRAFNGKPVKNLWSTKEIQQLQRLAGTMPVSEIAKKLGRKEKAITTKATRHGFRLGLIR